MRFGRVFAGVVVIAVLAGVTACVQQPPTLQNSPPAQTGSTSSSATPSTLSPSPSGSAGPNTDPTSSPTDEAPSTPKPAEANVQILDTRFDAETSGISVAGMVVNVVSDAGLCTATATQNGVSVSAAATSVADASVTYCAALVVQLPPGSTGEWLVSLAFDEGATHGSTTSSVVVG